MLKKWMFLSLAVLSLTAFGGKVKIAKDGEAVSRIVIDLDAPAPVQLAARELQNYFRQLSTARVSIMNGPAGWKTASFFLGTVDSPLIRPAIAKDPKLKKQLAGNDGYAVKVNGNKLYIMSSCPRGVLNGVHRFILRHTDFVWVRPRKELAVCTEDPNLTLDVKNYVDLPQFRLRSWQGNGNILYKSEEYEMFVSRLCCNLTFSLFPDALGRRLEHGFYLEYGGGHNLSTLWLPKKVFGKNHPEYYMMVNGQRRTSGRVQLCYTNPEMCKAFIDNALKVIAKMPKYFRRVNMMIDDTPACCECPECKKPLELPDGKTLQPNHPAFRSTQFFLFLNQVAEAVTAKYPQLEIKCFGYFFTAIPPEVPLHKSICVSFCPYIRNDKETLHGKSNAKWLERTVKYAKMSPNINWREYYYSMAFFPRAQANIIAQDLRFINTKGIRMVSSEESFADRAGVMKPAGCSENEVFTICGPEFWTISQLYWDPRQDPDELRNEYIRRTYREGAPGVQKFYQLLRDSWLNDPSPSAFNDDFRRSMGKYVIDKNLKQPCLDALAEAAKTVKDPRSKAQLEELQKTFGRWLELGVAGKVEELKVPKAAINDFPGFDFESGSWKQAAKLPPLLLMGKPTVKPNEPTEVKLMYNGETLYIGFRCSVNGKTEIQNGLKHDEWPGGDHIEIFIANRKDGYYHLAFNAAGCRYDGCVTESKWNAIWQVKTQVKDGEWRAVAAIPLKSVGIAPEQNNRVPALIYRSHPARGKKQPRQHSSWGAGKVHSVDSFSDLVFLLE